MRRLINNNKPDLKPGEYLDLLLDDSLYNTNTLVPSLKNYHKIVFDYDSSSTDGAEVLLGQMHIGSVANRWMIGINNSKIGLWSSAGSIIDLRHIPISEGVNTYELIINGTTVTQILNGTSYVDTVAVNGLAYTSTRDFTIGKQSSGLDRRIVCKLYEYTHGTEFFNMRQGSGLQVVGSEGNILTIDAGVLWKEGEIIEHCLLLDGVNAYLESVTDYTVISQFKIDTQITDYTAARGYYFSKGSPYSSLGGYRLEKYGNDANRYIASDPDEAPKVIYPSANPNRLTIEIKSVGADILAYEDDVLLFTSVGNAKLLVTSSDVLRVAAKHNTLSNLPMKLYSFQVNNEVFNCNEGSGNLITGSNGTVFKIIGNSKWEIV